MAMIKCPECGKDVSDKAAMCPNCGFGVAEYIESKTKMAQAQSEAEKEAYWYVKQKKKEEKEKAEQAQKLEESRKNNTYNQAVYKFESQFSKDVEEAEKLFLSIRGWKDSNVYISKCKERINELKQQEKVIFEKKKIRNTIMVVATVCIIAILSGMIGYWFIEIIPKQNYEKGIEALDKGQYDVAFEYLSKSDADDGRLISYAADAIMGLEFEKANVILEYVGTNSWLADEVQNAYYETACNMIKDKMIDEFNYCSERIENNDLEQKLYSLYVQYIYEEAEKNIQSEKYEEAFNLLIDLEKNDRYKWYEAKYEEAEGYYEKKEYELAYNLYAFLGFVHYEDASDKAKEAHRYFGTGEYTEEIPLTVYRSYNSSNTYEPTRKISEIVNALITVPYKDGVMDYSFVVIEFETSQWQGTKIGWGTANFRYEGEFIDNSMTGTGTLYNGGGQKIYSGEFLNGAFHGNGILYSAGRKKIEGNWEYNNIEGSYIEYDTNGAILSTGTVYSGIENDSVHGIHDYN